MLVMRAWGSKPQAVPPAPTAARNADLSSLPEVTEMLTAFQAFEEDAATAHMAPLGRGGLWWVMVGCSPHQDPDVYVNSVAIQEALQQRKMARLGTKKEVVSFGHYHASDL